MSELSRKSTTARVKIPVDKDRRTDGRAHHQVHPVVRLPRQSEAPLGERHGARCVLDFGRNSEVIRKDPRWQLWNTCRSIAAIPGGESWRQVQDRVVGALFDLQRVHPADNVVIISHGDVIRAALLFALGMPLDFYSRIEVALASISTIRLDSGGIRVLALNEAPRLPPSS